jgi:hypothetical protein
MPKRRRSDVAYPIRSGFAESADRYHCVPQMARFGTRCAWQGMLEFVADHRVGDEGIYSGESDLRG